VENIRQAKDFFKSAQVNDTVVLFIAGHGLHARDAAADYYFATHEVDPKRLPETAARFELVEDLLQGIRPRKKLFLMDTCESGEREKDERQSAGLPENARTLVARSARALELDVISTNTPREISGAKRKYYDRERYIYNDLTRRTGAIVISSSRGSEFSYELPEIANGVFTEEILLALTTETADRNQDKLVSTDELRQHLFQQVPKRTQDQQHPTVDRDNLDAHFGFPVVTEAASLVDRETLPAIESGAVGKTITPEKKPPAITNPRGCGCDVGQSRDASTSVLFAAFLATVVRLRRRAHRNAGN
jgi:Caspase domain